MKRLHGIWISLKMFNTEKSGDGLGSVISSNLRKTNDINTNYLYNYNLKLIKNI